MTDHTTPPAHLRVPNGGFSRLHLTRDSATGDVEFSSAPISEMRHLNNGWPYTDDDICWAINFLYDAHLRSGGSRNAAMDEIADEMRIEDAHGQHFSLPPGRA